jgi:F-type H+-transporting ATPase subunit delta
MAELTTVARPYAEAVFRLAKDTNGKEFWSEVLSILSATALDTEAAAYVANPRFATQQVRAVLADILGSRATPEVANFVGTILDNRRFTLLPKIAELFELMKAAEEGSVEAQIDSAFELAAEQLDELKAILSVKFKRNVTAHVRIEPELIGGVRITIGDDVVDASVRGKLASLTASLTS